MQMQKGIVIVLLFWFQMFFSQPKSYRIHTVAFYNFENLFDTINDPDTHDDERTADFQISTYFSPV